MRNKIVLGTLSVLLIVMSSSAMATSTTKIRFAKGSYCGSYSGDLRGGKNFIIALKADQELVVKNDSNDEYRINVESPNGRRLNGRYTTESELLYTTTKKGVHTVYASSDKGDNLIEFCAY